jgi:hypothetical protein
LYSEACPILNVEGFLAQACLAIIDESIVDVQAKDVCRAGLCHLDGQRSIAATNIENSTP